MAEHTSVRDAPWKKRIDPPEPEPEREARTPSRSECDPKRKYHHPNLQQRSWAPLRWGLQTQINQQSKLKTKCHSCRGGTCPTKRPLRAPLQCVAAGGAHVPQNVLEEHPSSVSQSNPRNQNSNLKIKLKISTTMQYKLKIQKNEN